MFLDSFWGVSRKVRGERALAENDDGKGQENSKAGEVLDLW